MGKETFRPVGVIGAGSWGTTLANLLAEKGFHVDLWVREQEVYRQIKEERVNRVFLPGIALSPGLRPVKSFEEALDGKQLIVMVVPSHVFREVLLGMKPHVAPGTPFVSATKGIENDTLLTMSQIAETVLGAESRAGLACLSGPSFAREVSDKKPTAVTLACRDLEQGRAVQQVFSTEFFRVYLTADLLGVELCGALKNVIALAAGIADGLDVGHDARAALITRGLAEMTRLGVALGARPSTFAGLAGLGDLVLTCTGELSRNRRVGLEIGKGRSLREIMEGMNMVAEGVKTSLSAYHLARKTGVEMPIVEQVYRVLYEGRNPREGVRDLMTRELKIEPEY